MYCFPITMLQKKGAPYKDAIGILTEPKNRHDNTKQDLVQFKNELIYVQKMKHKHKKRKEKEEGPKPTWKKDAVNALLECMPRADVSVNLVNHHV